MKTIQLCFLWHMHQPYYTDPITGSASMPWVRLHATKAYYDMAFLLDRFPQARSTFNFTPSLLLQLEEFSTGRVRDLFLEYAQRPAADLTPEEKAFLIRHFFSANWATMVRPFPRYQELLVKRGLDVHGQDLHRLAKQYSSQEFLDLQVWHNLAWFGYGSVQQFPRLAELRKKNRGFTEEDKQEMLALQQTAIRQIVPMYKALQDRGQVELTTTPFFHPILPLVIDSEFTRRARPDLPLPARFHAPADAEAQIRLAIDYHTNRHLAAACRTMAVGGVGLSGNVADVGESRDPLVGNGRRQSLPIVANQQSCLEPALSFVSALQRRPDRSSAHDGVPRS